MQKWPYSNMALEGMPRFSFSHINTLVNKSLKIGHSLWSGNAVVKPLLKKLGIELVFPSFKPFISKLTERYHLTSCVTIYTVRPLPSGQSAFRAFHSTEKHVWRYGLISSEHVWPKVIVMLDLSAVFDITNHSILLETWGSDFGVGGTALKWFTS